MKFMLADTERLDLISCAAVGALFGQYANITHGPNVEGDGTLALSSAQS
jgi:hypothetical protein